ncbi:MAG: type II toxin-antitoxin system RelE/ParE family toxin [Eggerthellaceae bacterium]|nr:type II toxin-antitoxin system RelE/ParE family toxin [Eggerthellaceae bacterium]
MADAHGQYRLRYLPLFWDDLNSAVSYIADVLEAPETAERLLDSVEAQILKRLSNPTIAPVYKTTRERPLPYYWFEVGSYMAFYVVIDDVVEMRRFIYGARDLTRMLP